MSDGSSAYKARSNIRLVIEDSKVDQICIQPRLFDFPG